VIGDFGLFSDLGEMAAEEGQVIGCHTNDVWTVQLDKAKESNKLVSILTPLLCNSLCLCWIWELGFCLIRVTVSSVKESIMVSHVMV